MEDRFAEYVRTFFGYLFGTFGRFRATMIVSLVIFAYFRADLVEAAIARLLIAVGRGMEPFIPLALVLLLIFLGYRTLWRGMFGGGGGKKKK